MTLQPSCLQFTLSLASSCLFSISSSFSPELPSFLSLKVFFLYNFLFYQQLEAPHARHFMIQLSVLQFLLQQKYKSLQHGFRLSICLRLTTRKYLQNLLSGIDIHKRKLLCASKKPCLMTLLVSFVEVCPL